MHEYNEEEMNKNDHYHQKYSPYSKWRYESNSFSKSKNNKIKINLSNLKKIYGEKTVVNIPEYTINHGEILGLVGNNGAGKTTLFRMILDLLDRTEGDVSLEFVQAENNSYSIDPHTSEEWKKTTVAYIDDSFLIDFLTPEEYFDFVLGKILNLLFGNTVISD